MSALRERMKSADAETHWRRLTQENPISRLALLNLDWLVGIFRETFHCRKAETGGFLPSSAVNEQLPEGFGPIRLSHTAHRRSAEAPRSGRSSEFRDLRAMSMTKNEGAQAAIPHQGIRNLSCRAWFSSPRGTTMTNKNRREKTRTRRFSHGIARTVEGLRGMRLSLVSRPNPRECVLQGV